MSRGRLLIRAVQIAALALVAWFLYRGLAGELSELSWTDISRLRPDPLTIAASFILLQGVYIAHALLWRTIVRDLRLGDLSLRRTLYVYFMAGLGKYVPGKVWALAGMAVLAGRAGLPPIAATAAAVLGQIAFLATGMLFLALSFPQWRSELDTGYGAGAAVLVIGLILGGALLWLLVATPAGHRVRERIAAATGDRAGEKLRAAFALADRITPRAAAAWAIAYTMTWVALGAAFAVFVMAFEPAAAGEWRFLAGTIAASYLVGYLLPVPAGIGSREGIMILLLHRVLPDAGSALVVSVLSRIWFTAAELLPLAILPLLPGDPSMEEVDP